MPKVSVIIPTYNCAQYIPEAIESVLNQTYKDFEVIVIDDGSTDNTKDVLKVYIEKGHIRYYCQKNKGVSGARNKGISEAKGEYVAFLDSDDLWLPTFLERTCSLLQHSDYDLAVTDWYRVVLDGEREISRELKVREIPTELKKLLKTLFLDFVGTYCTMQRKSIFGRIGYFDEDLFVGEDLDIWIRFAKGGIRVGVVHEPLFIYRKRQESLTTKSTPKSLISRYRFIKKYEYIILPDNCMRKVYSQKLRNMARESLSLNENIRSKMFFLMKFLLKSQIYNFSLEGAMRPFYSFCKKTI